MKQKQEEKRNKKENEESDTNIKKENESADKLEEDVPDASSAKPPSVDSSSTLTKEHYKQKKTDEKLEESKLAYEAWLDYIEAREEEKMMFDEERKRILMWKPPWYPGGKAMF